MKHLVFLLLFIPSIYSSAQSTLTLDDLNAIVSLSSPALSPNGKAGVFLATYRNYDQNSFDTELRWISIQDGKQSVLSSRDGLRDPAWTRDGQYISFLASTANGSQVFLLPINGGEAQQLTDHPQGIRKYAWSPTGKRLAFIAFDPGSKKSGSEAFNDSFEVGSDDYLQTKAPVGSSVWIFDPATRASKKLSPDNFTVATELALSGLEWSDDEQQILVTRFPSSHSGDTDLGEYYSLFLDGAAAEKIFQGKAGGGLAFFHKKGKSVLFGHRRNGAPEQVIDLYEVDLQQKEVKNLTQKLDRNIQNAFFIPDGQLLVSAPDQDRLAYWSIDETEDFTKIPFGELTGPGELSFSAAGGILFTGQTSYRPDELYFKADIRAKPELLTHFNEPIAEKKQGKREIFDWKSTDGFRPNGVITYPPDFDAKKKYPLVLFIHGGPTASSLLSFSIVPQIMAARGWIVFQPNYRGSNNLGNAFQSAIANDAAEGPGEDVMSGVQALIAKGFIDTDKIAVSGWSYGGWMTSWMIGRYPDVWAAAVAGAAPVDYTDMYSLSDLNRMRRHAITESPYVGDHLMDVYQKSPIYHFNKLKTPTLIMSKTADYRVSITGSYKLYGALRDNNVPVQFIAYPGPGHFPSDPVRSTDVYARWIGWLTEYIGRKLP
ncbi:MAG: S9 family peptidase [Saprospiraceae bacterium]|nr:S9 family peptidase [Lewinella sp.]